MPLARHIPVKKIIANENSMSTSISLTKCHDFEALAIRALQGTRQAKQRSCFFYILIDFSGYYNLQLDAAMAGCYYLLTGR
jgi:hypothetical protein